MQVSVEATSELTRVMKVQVPEEEIQSEIAKRLQSLAQKVRLDGFRPGKIPGSVIKKRFSRPVRQEVLAEMIQSSLYEALTEEKLQPAGVPAIDQKEGDEGVGLEYEASFEIYPKITLAPFENLSVDCPTCEIRETDIDAMVEKLRLQKREWREVSRDAARDDQVKISFSGVCEGENFTDGTVEHYPVILGEQKMVPGFEDHLVGMATGEEKKFNIDFPDDYGNEKLSGNNAEFTVKLESVEESILPDPDEEFIKSFGVESGDMQDFRSDLRKRMSAEADRAVRNKTKSAVMEALLAGNSISLPKVMVDKEIEQIRESLKSSADGLSESVGDEQRDYFEKESRRRVSLGLLLAEIIKENNLEADASRVRQTVEELAQGYDSPDDVVNWYYSNAEQLKNIEHMVLEEQAVDLVLERASVTSEQLEFDSLTGQ